MYLSTSVTFLHDDELASGEALYRLYQYTDILNNAILNTLSTDGVRYIGKKSVAADFQLTIQGNSVGVAMDASEQRYFENATFDFLDSFVESNYIEFLDVKLDQTNTSKARVLRALGNTGSVNLQGYILAAQYSHLLPAAFLDALRRTFLDKQTTYTSLLQQGSFLPGVLQESSDPTYFESLISVGGTFDIKKDSTPLYTGSTTPSTNGSSSMMIVAIAAAAGTLFLLVGIFLLRRYLKRRAEFKQEVEKLRRNRRKEDKKRREFQSKTKSNLGNQRPFDTEASTIDEGKVIRESVDTVYSDGKTLEMDIDGTCSPDKYGSDNFDLFLF